jgi:hypothetical protein
MLPQAEQKAYNALSSIIVLISIQGYCFAKQGFSEIPDDVLEEELKQTEILECCGGFTITSGNPLLSIIPLTIPFRHTEAICYHS